jgi:hypothetical protein
MIIRIKKPIEKTFHCWINNYPESYHPCDMERFYIFVRTVARYSRNPKSGIWLREKLKKYKHHLEVDDITYYCNLFDTLIAYSKVGPLNPYWPRKDDEPIDEEFEERVKL